MLNVWVAVELLVMPALDDTVCAPLKLLIKYAFAFVRNVIFLVDLVGQYNSVIVGSIITKLYFICGGAGTGG